MKIHQKQYITVGIVPLLVVSFLFTLVQPESVEHKIHQECQLHIFFSAIHGAKKRRSLTSMIEYPLDSFQNRQDLSLFKDTAR